MTADEGGREGLSPPRLRMVARAVATGGTSVAEKWTEAKYSGATYLREGNTLPKSNFTF